MIFLQSITLTNSPALRGHGDGLQDLDRLNAFFFFGSRKSRHGGLTDTRNFFGLIWIVAGHWLPCKRVHFRKLLHFCDHIFPLFLIIFIFQTTKSAHFFSTQMAKNFGVECFPRNYCVTFTLCAVIVVLAISCIPQSVHGNHVPQPGSRNANPTRGRNIRPEVRTTPQRRRGSPQQQAPSRAASSSRRFSVQQNARAATQQRASASRRTNQRGEPSSRTRQVGIRGTIRG